MPFAIRGQVYVSDYTFYAYTSSFSSIAATGTELPLNSINSAAPLTLPFTFHFGQESCTSVMVGSNGQIGIGSANPSVNGIFSPHTSDMSIISPLAAPYNLSPTDGSGHVYYEVMGSAPNRSVVIEYHDPACDTNLSNTLIFQVVLHETGDIEFIYDTCDLDLTASMYVFMREQTANRAVFVNGTWANPGVSSTVATMSLSATNKPIPGLTLSFTREERNCPRPTNFICRSFSRPDSIYFAWSASPLASMWELRYDTIGTPVDSMQHVEQYISDTFFVCNNMVAGGAYEAYLRTDCGSEYSFWEGPVLVTPGSFIMPVSGNNTIYACGGVIYDNGGSTGNYDNNSASTLTVMPSAPDSLVAIQGTLSTESCCDHLYIYDGVGINGTLLYQGQGVSQIVPLVVSTSGPLTIRFVSDGSVVNSGFALQVSCQAAPDCRMVSDVEVSHVAGASAYVQWELLGTFAMPSYYVLTLHDRTNPGVAPIVDTTSSLHYFLTGLSPQTDYTIEVSSICGLDTLFGDSVQFSTRCLVGGLSSPSGTDQTTFSGIPVYTSWGNTFCQSIYTPADLSAMGVHSGPITGITYTWASAGSYNKEISIFMGQTTNSTFSSFSPLTGCMNLVYQGARNTSDVGTIEYVFTTPFIWDGVSNIVVSSFVNQPTGVSHSSSGFLAYATNAGVTRSIYGYKDGTAYTISNLTTNSGTSTSTFRPNIQFLVPCDTNATCAAPNAFVTSVDLDTVEIVWAPGNTETSWDIYYRAAADTTWTVAYTGLTERGYTITGLQPMTEYQIRISPDCGSDTVFTMLSVITPCSPITTLPFTEDFENFTATSTAGSPITACWSRGTSYPSVSYPNLSTTTPYDGSYSIYFYSTTSYYSYLALPVIGHAIDSLTISFAARGSSSNYDIIVGTMTDPADATTFSPVATVTTTNTWQMYEVPLTSATSGQNIALMCSGGTRMVYVDNIEVDLIFSCPRPASVTSSPVTTNTATIHWSAPASNYFEIEYGPAGFTHGTGTIVTSSSDSVTLYGLRHSSRYDVYVRGLCSSSDTSRWSFLHQFTTLCGVIDSLPYSVTFQGWGSGVGARPACWTCGGYSSYPFISLYTLPGAEPVPSLYFYTYNASTYASMPELDSVTYPVEMTNLRFRAWTAQNIEAQAIVGVCTIPGDLTTFTPADTFTVTDERTLFEATFDAIPGSGKYITIVSQPQGSSVTNYFYVDSVVVDLIPSCQRPNHLRTAAVTATTADVSWTEHNSTTTWQIEYGVHGFVLGTGTRITTTANPTTLTGLTPSTAYDFYVRSICTLTDTSLWSIAPGQFNTQQNPATIPYYYDFETPDEWDNWQTSSNTTINWYRDTAGGDGTPGYNTGSYYSMFVSADTGRTYSTDLNQIVNAAAYRDIDFGPVDSAFTLSFRARAGGTPSQGYDALMVFLVDPSTPVVASNSNITSPWGSVLDLTPLVTVRVNYYWNTYNVTLDTLSGVHRLAFFWFNQSTASTPFVGGPAAVDNISIDYIQCPRPAGVHASRVTMTTADIEWTGGPDNADYRVFCRSATGAVVFDQYVTVNHAHISGLDPGTRYNVVVRRICSSSDSSLLSVPGSFITNLCNDGFIDTVGTYLPGTTTFQLPYNSYYNYTYTQQIITADELAGPGEISAINFRYTHTAATTAKTNCTIYLGHTTLSSFTDRNTIVSPDSMQIVYTGNLNCEEGWNRILFNYPFNYDGVSNLVIAVDDNSGAYNTSSHTFSMTPTTSMRSICFFSDSYNPDPTSRRTLTAFNGSVQPLALINHMLLEYCPPTTCPNPVLVDPIIRPERVTLRWRNTGSAYQIGYRPASTSSWIVNSFTLTDTFYVINNVLPMTDYVYQVRQYCDSTGISNWEIGTFNSNDIPCLEPSNIQVDNVTHNKVSLSWTPEQNNISYRVHVFNTAFEKYQTSYLSNKTVSGLEANTRYYAAVQASCQDIEDPSAWSDTITFVTDYCPDVTDLVYSDLQGNSVTLDWTEGGRATQWEIEYGYSGFDQGTGFRVVVDTHPYTLTGLIGESIYDIYVRAICGTNFYSEHWSNVVTITTPYSSISGVSDDPRVVIAPNPTRTDVTLTLPATTSPVRVEVLDMSGRSLHTLTLPASTSSAQLPTSRFAQGTYFVRITSDDLNAVRKLVVE